ncbi:MAG: SOS response-associated peptidase family protein [Chitinophagaceae bacterium]|nr:SOS response-associated peptidase family protein [Chitinophagaceae bacterium]
MCYYNGTKVTRDEYIRLKHLEKLVANYQFMDRDVINGFDFGVTAIVKPVEGKEDIEIVPMEWGFIPDPGVWPFWETREQVNQGRRPHKDPRGKFVDGLNFLNAVSEEIVKKGKVYRTAALNRRCLFISSGYYEWRHIFPLNKRTGEPLKTAKKYPYRVGYKGRDYFFIAGIWQEWSDAETGETVNSAALTTTSGNLVTGHIHNSKNRMPTMLTEDLAWEWLFGNLSEQRVQEIASFQLPWEDISYYTLAKDFLSSHEPWKEHFYPELPPLDIPGAEAPAPQGQMELF